MPDDPVQLLRDQADSARRFASEVVPHIRAAYAYAYLLSRNREAAEDLTQDAMVRAFRSFADCRGAARPWLMAIVRNCFLSSVQGRPGAEHPSLTVVSDEASSCKAPDPAPDPELALMAKSEALAVRETLAALPQPYREVLVLREFEDLSYHEIADVIGCPIGTVMSRLSRARVMFATRWTGSEGYGAAAPTKTDGDGR